MSRNCGGIAGNVTPTTRNASAGQTTLTFLQVSSSRRSDNFITFSTSVKKFLACLESRHFAPQGFSKRQGLTRRVASSREDRSIVIDDEGLEFKREAFNGRSSEGSGQGAGALRFCCIKGFPSFLLDNSLTLDTW